MKKREVFTIVLAVLLALASFVGCNSEVNDGVNVPATVSFAPTARKSLNQQGSSTQFAKDVESYHWEYFISETAPGNDADSLEWKEFYENQPSVGGLGKINGLTKGNYYYFGLRGYTTGTNTPTDLIWEGFHGGTITNAASVRLMSKTQYITIDVYAKGKGYLYYDIFAPWDSTDETTASDCLPTGVTNVRFVSSYVSLSDETVSATNYLPAVKTQRVGTEGDVWQFQTEEGKEEELETGVYLFTVQEQYWDATMNQWFDKNDRRQILIVNIASGVDTVIAGSLDSTSTEQFDYYANDPTGGMKINFHQATSTVAPLTATVYKSTNTNTEIVTATRGFHTVNVLNGSFVRIDWSTKTNVKYFINGEEIKTTGTDAYATDTNGYFILKDGTSSKVKYQSDTDYPGLLCEGYYQNDYIVSIVREGDTNEKDESVSFTIKGYNSDNYITFESDKPFTIKMPTEKKWTAEGILQYSTDKTSWTNINENDTLTSGEKNDVYYIYVRGTGISQINPNGPTGKWTITPTTGYLVSCYGNIENLLDYQTVARGEHPTMGQNCFAYMFYECEALSSAPYLMAEDLSLGCYKYMFTSCTNLKDAPELPAETLKDNCYLEMFKNCSKLKSIKFSFTSLGSVTTPVTGWLDNVKATGRYVCPSNVTTAVVDTIPSGWTNSSWN